MKTMLINALIALTALAASAAASAEIELKLHHFLSAKAPSHTAMLVPWARRVEALSGGKVAIEIFPSMTLGGRPPELVQQARDGVVDLIWTLNGYTPGQFPRTEVFELPGVYVNDPAGTNLAMRALFARELQEDYRGLEVMFLHVHSGQALQMRDRPARRPADLAGTRLRVPSRTGAWMIEALGATPVSMPVPTLPQALAKGVVDGAFIPFEIIPALKIHEQTAYQIEGAAAERFGSATFQVSMNKARWDSLPADVQAAFRKASDPAWLRELGDIWRETEDFGVALAVRQGNTHIVLTEAETQAFRDALAPVRERWINAVAGLGVDGAALIDKARAALAAHSAR